MIASAPLHAGVSVRLRIEARAGRYDLDYAEARGPWRTLVKDADGTQLSTETAGGFVGVMIGPYAYAAPN